VSITEYTNVDIAESSFEGAVAYAFSVTVPDDPTEMGLLYTGLVPEGSIPSTVYRMVAPGVTVDKVIEVSAETEPDTGDAVGSATAGVGDWKANMAQWFTTAVGVFKTKRVPSFHAPLPV
jgi:hypothetical protein